MAGVLLLVLAPPALVASMVGFRDELDSLAVVSLVLALVCLGAALVLVLRDRRALCGTRASRLPAGPGLHFRQSRAWQAALVLGLPSFAVLGVLTSLQLSREDDPGGGAPVLYAATALVSAWALWFLVPVLAGRARGGGLRVTEDGLTLRSWGSSLHLAWDDVLAPTDHRPSTVATVGRGGAAVTVVAAPGRSVRFDAGPMRYRTFPSRSRPDLLVPVIDLAGNAAVLAHAVAFYAEHPELRVELADHRARERVMAGNAISAHLVTPPEKEKK